MENTHREKHFQCADHDNTDTFLITIHNISRATKGKKTRRRENACRISFLHFVTA